jgi:hypothetical protein
MSPRTEKSFLEKYEERKICTWRPAGSPLLSSSFVSVLLHSPELVPFLPVRILEGKAKDNLDTVL